MVPCHPFNEMKPNSGRGAAEPRRFIAKRSLKNDSLNDRYRPGLFLGGSVSPFRRGIATTETREPFTHVARLVEMTRNALRATADGKCQAVEIRHDREHALVGDVVTDENRPAALERLMRHQFDDARCL